MDQLDLRQDSILFGEQEYAMALDTVIAVAQQRLLIFDQDCSIGHFTSVKRYDLIHAFLIKNATTQLTIILQNVNFFTLHCPRLYALLATYSHKIKIYETNNSAKAEKDCFIIADNQAYIRRFHIDQARFKYALNDAETTASLVDRFEALLQETSRALSATQLGLS
ncbi:MAG: hypothetical protein KFB94_02840 [Methylophilaceae bacterium]|jgi:hypothetical protein|nr:MAG: hypothetical protein KFB94_02840 [Methylophilaceae bacterium]